MTRRPALSLCLYVKNRRVLLVGSGSGSDERERRLRDAGADILRVSEDNWRPPEHEKIFVVIANAEDDELNREVAAWARGNGYLCYAHDQPAVSDFSFPALASRGPLQLAVSSNGVAPALASRLRREFETLLEASGPKLDRLLDELERIREKFPPGAERIQTLRRMAAHVRLVGALEIDED